MARFLFLLIASLSVAVGKPHNSFLSAREPGVLAQQLSGTAGAGSIPLSNSDGKVPDSNLQDFSDNAITFPDPNAVESAIPENSLNPSSDLVASTPNSCPNPASKLRKRQDLLHFLLDGLQNPPFLNMFKSPPPDPSFCSNSPNALTQQGGSTDPERGTEVPSQDGQPIVTQKQPKKSHQTTEQKEPEPMVSGPGEPFCPYMHPHKVCCRGNLTAQLFYGFGALLEDCWDCELL